MAEHVTFGIDEGVGIITLNRPERLNALTDAMHPELNAVFATAFRAQEARVIILTGAGRAFCAGADMARLNRFAASKGADFDLPRPGLPAPEFDGLDAPRDLLTTYTAPLAFPKPVIAAVNGPALGVGFVLAATCDIRFAAKNSFFSAAFPQRGICAESGLAWLLPRLIGHGPAADILLSSRRVPAEEALAMGLVTRVEEEDALLPAALAYAKTIAATAAPRALALTKRQLWVGHWQTFGQAAMNAHDLLLKCLAGAEYAEGVASFQEKRAPCFAAL